MIEHNGYTLTCDLPECSEQFHAPVSRRTTIQRARGHRWFVGRIRVTAGGKPMSRSLHLCQRHSFMVSP